MSTNKSEKKRVVVSSKNKKKAAPSAPRQRAAASAVKKQPSELIFKKPFYMLVLGGLGLIFLGLICMMGGAQPSPDVWEDDIIYNWRITVLAPILILAGLAVEIYAIFKRF